MQTLVVAVLGVWVALVTWAFLRVARRIALLEMVTSVVIDQLEKPSGKES